MGTVNRSSTHPIFDSAPLRPVWVRSDALASAARVRVCVAFGVRQSRTVPVSAALRASALPHVVNALAPASVAAVRARANAMRMAAHRRERVSPSRGQAVRPGAFRPVAVAPAVRATGAACRSTTASTATARPQASLRRAAAPAAAHTRFQRKPRPAYSRCTATRKRSAPPLRAASIACTTTPCDASASAAINTSWFFGSKRATADATWPNVTRWRST